jgi:hypothetical protein
MLSVHSQMSPPTKGKTLEPNLRRYKQTALKAASVDV